MCQFDNLHVFPKQKKLAFFQGAIFVMNEGTHNIKGKSLSSEGGPVLQP